MAPVQQAAYAEFFAVEIADDPKKISTNFLN